MFYFVVLICCYSCLFQNSMQVLVLSRDSHHKADGSSIDMRSPIRLQSVLFREWVSHLIPWEKPKLLLCWCELITVETILPTEIDIAIHLPTTLTWAVWWVWAISENEVNFTGQPPHQNPDYYYADTNKLTAQFFKYLCRLLNWTAIDDPTIGDTDGSFSGWRH